MKTSKQKKNDLFFEKISKSSKFIEQKDVIGLFAFLEQFCLALFCFK